MKLVLLSVFALTILFSIGSSPAEAQSTYCYHFTNFCDQIQVTRDPTGGWIGQWDFECNGFLSSVAGKGGHVITRPVFSGSGLPAAETFRFRFFKREKVFHLYSTNGTTFNTVQFNQPFTREKASCVFTINSGPNKKPSLAGAWAKE